MQTFTDQQKLRDLAEHVRCLPKPVASTPEGQAALTVAVAHLYSALAVLDAFAPPTPSEAPTLPQNELPEDAP